MKIKLSFLSYVAVIINFAACTATQQDSSKIQPRPEVKAAEKIEDSVQAKNSNELVILKSALNKEFLLMGSLITQAPVPLFSGIKSRVVAFERIGSELVMLEATQGHILNTNYPTKLVLSKFTIKSENKSTLQIDFNEGMKDLFMGSEMYAQDGESYDPFFNLKPSHLKKSYIEKIDKVDNMLVISQRALLEADPNPEDLGSVLAPGEIPVQVKYYLQPYLPNPKFKPLVSPGFKRFGFFESSPLLNEDRTELIHAVRFDLNKKIQFAISANTPEVVRPAIIDAINYWKSATGSSNIEILQLNDSKIMAPNPLYNIIQWYEDEEAGYAYADSQIDPRSGEILHAQIFLPSTFFLGNRDVLLKTLYRLLQDSTNSQKNVLIKGFEKKGFCRFSYNKKNLESLALMIEKKDISDKVIETALLDLLRETIAHELGHVMGLRHNFAASLQTEIPESELQDEVAQYFKNQAKYVSTRAPSSSVMDYEEIENSLLTGSMIAQGKLLKYDQRAMAILYQGQIIKDQEPLFCTDSDLMKYQDCQQFDSGAHLPQSAVLSFQRQLSRVPYRFSQKVLRAAKKLTSLKDIAWAPKNDGKLLAENWVPLIKSLSQKGALAFVQKNHGLDFVLNNPRMLEMNELEKSFLEMGGTAGVLNTAFQFYFPNSGKNFEAVIEDQVSLWKSDLEVLMSQWPKSISEDSKVWIRKYSEKYFKDFLDSYNKELLSVLSFRNASFEAPEGTLHYEDQAFINEAWGLELQKIAERIVTDKNGQFMKAQFTSKDSKKVNLDLPLYQFSFLHRKGAVGLLSKEMSADVLWGHLATENVVAELNQDQEFEGTKIEDIPQSELKRDAQKWFMENSILIGK